MNTRALKHPVSGDGMSLKSGLILAAILLNVVLLMTGDAFAWLREYPEAWVWGIAGATTTAVKYVVNDMGIGGITPAMKLRMAA